MRRKSRAKAAAPGSLRPLHPTPRLLACGPGEARAGARPPPPPPLTGPQGARCSRADAGPGPGPSGPARWSRPLQPGGPGRLPRAGTLAFLALFPSWGCPQGQSRLPSNSGGQSVKSAGARSLRRPWAAPVLVASLTWQGPPLSDPFLHSCVTFRLCVHLSLSRNDTCDGIYCSPGQPRAVSSP